LATVYGLVIFGLARYIFQFNIPIYEQLFLAAATGIAGMSFQHFRGYFDRATTRIFYRDTYDVQIFIDDFNKVLVGAYRPIVLLKRAIGVIDGNIKPAFCVFGIKETLNLPRRIVGTNESPSFSTEDIDYVRKITVNMKERLIIVDQLDGTHYELQKVLQKYEIAVLARIAPSLHEEGIGYLMLGAKKSGNIYTQQDIRVLEIITNALVIALQNALRYEQIESFNETLQEKVDDATRKLRRSNEKLKTLDETKDDFISMASHQLRTPLTSIKGYLSMVLEEDAGKLTKMQREMLGQAFLSSQRMVYLIADLLNVSRLKTGKFIIETAPVNLADVVEQELVQLDETAAARSLMLRYDKPEHFPELMLDETKIRQVVMNFADNAIYYTPAGGRITVELLDKGATVELRISDSGIGVPKSEQPHLFTKFYRAGNARQARPDGTGLGLFMAKKVVLAQGGSLIFESKEGKGSTFGFIFSKSRVAVPRPAHDEDKKPAKETAQAPSK
jgi:signal transduction histidine kinase